MTAFPAAQAPLRMGVPGLGRPFTLTCASDERPEGLVHHQVEAPAP
jgi:hypothetical protein